MSQTIQSMRRNNWRAEVMPALRFSGKFLAAFAAFCATFWILGRAFAFSKWAGFLAVVVVTIALYASAHRWITWLPGLLALGVLNSILGLITHHAPTNPNVRLSIGLGLLLLMFYAVGTGVSYLYHDQRLEVLDRCAFLLYVASMIWPAFTAGSNLGIVTPPIAWSAAIGMASIVISYRIHRGRIGKKID